MYKESGMEKETYFSMKNALTVNGDLTLVETAFTGAGTVFISRTVID